MIQIEICRILVDLNSTIIKWPIYSNIVISPVSCDADCLVIFPMLKLSFCWSISSTTPTPTIHLYYPLTNMVKEYVVLRTNIHPKSGRRHQKVDVPSLATNYTVV